MKAAKKRPSRAQRVFEAIVEQPPITAPAKTILPTDSAVRKQYPMTRGFLDYFSAAVAEVSRVSFIGNLKHNPGEELHHSRGKSSDHADCIVRHLLERGGFDYVEITEPETGVVTVYEVRHTAYLAWRAMALLQEELEADGAPLARGARLA
jgi:hypothetical protein